MDIIEIKSIKLEKRVIKNINTYIYKTDKPKYILIQPVDDSDLDVLESEIKYIKESGFEFILVAFKVRDWNADLSPWKAKAIFKDNDFKGNGENTLKFIEEDLVKEVREIKEVKKIINGEEMPFIIGGYSLAALFSIWACYKTNIFKGVASASASLWFEGFSDFIKDKKINAKAIYLSLGDKEPKSRNNTLRKVGDETLALYEKIKDEGTSIFFEWNEGNHFMDSDKRGAKAFINVMEQLDNFYE